MKAKLTITVDEDLIPEAKRFARLQGLSLSQLIEDSLRRATSAEKRTFAERWRGRFHPADRDDDRYDYLARKYLS